MWVILEDAIKCKIASPREQDESDTYNFQKASCTLDASIKIYSYRVDDTWNSSFKILENLSSNNDKTSVSEKIAQKDTSKKVCDKSSYIHSVQLGC